MNASINPFFAARMSRPASIALDNKPKTIYVKLPAAPINASPVPHLTSLYHNAKAGEYGDRSYPGNCGGNLIKDLLSYFKPCLVFDPMAGSGTCRDVCDELRIPCLSWDIHDGFDACDPAVFSATEAFDFIWAHPAYWRQKLYCVAKNVMWCPPRLPLGREGTAQSGSHIIIATALCDGAPPKLVGPGRGSGPARCYKIETADLTAMRDIELRDEFSGLFALRYADITTCVDECCKSNGPVEKVQMVFWFGSWLVGVTSLRAAQALC